MEDFINPDELFSATLTPALRIITASLSEVTIHVHPDSKAHAHNYGKYCTCWV